MIETTINDAQTMRDEAAGSTGRLRPGDEILGRYVVESELGQGGMGVVYKCLDRIGRVEVAVKGLPPEVSHNADEMEEIRDNYSLVEGLRHPNICGIKTLEKDARGDYYLVMDLARGVNLNRWLRQHSEATDAEKLAILRQIASALDYAHARKIIHRDVKPENVMVADDGTVQVLDFGLAAQVRSSLSRTSRAVVSTSGTPGYKAPEQWRGQTQGPQADLYALGAIAYKFFAGHLPYEGEDLVILGQAVLNEPVPRIGSASSVVNAAFAKALAKRPEERFVSCGAFIAALEGQTHVTPKRPLGKIVAVAALLALLAGGGFLYKHQADVQEAARVAKVEADRKAAREKAEAEAKRLAEEKAKFAETLAAAKAFQLKLALDEGRAYVGAAQWEKALAAAERALAWDATSEDAMKLKSAAESHLSPSLKLVVQVEGREVEGAQVTIDGKDYTSPVELKNLEKGSRLASLSASYEAGGKRYRQTFAALDVDWSGPKTLALTLPEVKEPQPGEVKVFDLPNGVRMKFAWCPAGTFTMGSPTDETVRYSNEAPHRVTLTKGFWMGQFEVTQAQWRAVMENNPSGFKGDDNRPVESVSWVDCRKFVEKCNAAATGVRFALPTEAQWEYACRAGTTGPYAGTENLDEMGWHWGNSGEWQPHPVGQKKPNAWNLYDMHGNVWEWCADWYGAYEGGCTDPTGPASGEYRVLRGGSWFIDPSNCRSAARRPGMPGGSGRSSGFRLCCTAGPHE